MQELKDYKDPTVLTRVADTTISVVLGTTVVVLGVALTIGMAAKEKLDAYRELP